MLSMFPLRCLPRGKYSDVVMLLWYHLVPWNTDLSSCWRTMQESHHWFPSILCNSIAPQHPSTIERKMRCHWLQTSTKVWWSCCTASTCFIATLIRHASAALCCLFYNFSRILAPIFLLNQCRCLQRWLTMQFELFNGRSVKSLLCCVHFHVQFAVRSTSIAKPEGCTQQTYHSQRSFWHKHTLTNLHRKLHILIFIEFQCTYGLLGCDGEMVVTSELKFRQFFTIPSTVKVRPFLTRRCTREKCHVTVIFGSFSDLNFGKMPEINKKPENNEAWSE